jgi:hypothetical protein
MVPKPTGMSLNDPIAACGRLASIFERAVALEEVGRLATDDSVHAPIVPFVIAQLRMRVIPALSPQWANDPVHVVLFGGTNSGKSTVLNILLGRDAAAMAVRARFSQHPEAYRSETLGDGWLEAFPSRFLGYAHYRNERPPRQSDDELRASGYQPRLAIFNLNGVPGDLPLGATAAVLWDGPDYSTEEAQTYMATVLDLAALADLIVVTVTDESYADARGHALLRMLSDSGVALHVAANKLPESPALLDDITTTLAASGRVQGPIHRLPAVSGATPSERLRSLRGTPESSAFREAIALETAQGLALKVQGVRGALALIERHWQSVLQPLEEELTLAGRWAGVVDRITRERVLEPYRREYLDGARFGEFNRTLVAVLQLLQVPFIGPLVELLGKVVRAPFRLAIAVFRRLSGQRGRASGPPPEHEVLTETVDNWLVALKAEAQALASEAPNPAWLELVGRLDGGDFRARIMGQFDEAFARYRKDIDEVIRQRAARIYEKLREDPRRLNVLRGANLLGNAATVAIVVKSGGFDWSDAVAGPVVAGFWQSLLEWGLGRHLETHRAGLKQDQFRALENLAEANLSRPAADLFRGAVTADELTAARNDFTLVTQAVTRVCERTAP